VSELALPWDDDEEPSEEELEAIEEAEPPPPPAADFLVSQEPWMDLANCKGKSHLFFLAPGQSAEPGRRLCRACIVAEPCLDYARRTRSEGMWAGEIFRSAGKVRQSFELPEPVVIGDFRPQRLNGDNSHGADTVAPVQIAASYPRPQNE
jgi:hypothetical protein